MRYLVTHDSQCGCREPQPQSYATPQAVSLALWGRFIDKHHIWDGECPYHFLTGSCDAIVRILEQYPVDTVRHVLPLDVYEEGLLCCSIGEETLT